MPAGGNQVIAIGNRLKKCRNVRTLGLRTNFPDYTPEEAALIRRAAKIYYPTIFYADIFDAMGKRLFPSYHTYKWAQDKIKQTTFFHLAGIPHPATRTYYGRRKTPENILQDFSFPFIAKIPRGSALGRGVYLIKDDQDLAQYTAVHNPAYIQEYLPADRDIRVVVIGGRVVHAYWRLGAPGEFRNNLGAGGTVSLEAVPPKALELALHAARTAVWDDVGIDIIQHGERFYIVEANMKYGREGFEQAGIDYYRLMENLIAEGVI